MNKHKVGDLVWINTLVGLGVITKTDLFDQSYMVLWFNDYWEERHRRWFNEKEITDFRERLEKYVEAQRR